MNKPPPHADSGAAPSTRRELESQLPGYPIPGHQGWGNGEPARGYRLMTEVQRVHEATRVQSVQEGADAFRPIYETYAPGVMRFLYRMCGDRALAEDLTQDVFLKVWRSASRWRPEAPVHTWILQIARRHGWNAMAFRRRRSPVWQRSSGKRSATGNAIALSNAVRVARSATVTSTARVGKTAAAHDASPLEQAVAQELGAALGRALLTLSPKLRVVFVLARCEHLALSEIAQVVGIPIGTVKSRLARADQRLRKVVYA